MRMRKHRICIAVLFVMWKIAAGAAGDGYGPAAGDSGPGLTVHGEAEPEAVPCRIYDWRSKTSLRFMDLKEK